MEAGGLNLYHRDVKKVVSVRKKGDVVHLILYNGRDDHEKYFEAKVPADDPEQIYMMLEAAFSKGMSRPKLSIHDSSWWG